MNFISKRPLFTAAMIFLVTGVLSYYADRKLRVIGIIALFGALLVMLVVCAAVAIRHKKPGFLRRSSIRKQ